MEFLEILARGTVTEHQTLVSKEFARNVLKIFELEGCSSENGHEILMDKVEKAFEDGIYDIEMLN